MEQDETSEAPLAETLRGFVRHGSGASKSASGLWALRQRLRSDPTARGALYGVAGVEGVAGEAGGVVGRVIDAGL